MKLTGTTMVNILSLKGELVTQAKFQNYDRIELDVSALVKGLYLLKILTKEGIEVKKLVIR